MAPRESMFDHHLRPLRWLMGVAVAAAFGIASCGDSDSSSGGSAADTTTSSTSTTGAAETSSTGSSGGDDSNGDDDGGSGGSTTFSITNAEIAVIVNGGSYTSWAAEDGVQSARHGSPHGPVRSYFNDLLATSIAAGGSAHPAGSGVIKLVYAADRATLTAVAAGFKTTAEAGASNWYWYESLSGNTDIATLEAPKYSGVGHGTCAPCHSASPAVDGIFTAPSP